MNEETAAIVETIKKLALLADALERRSAAAIQSQQQAEQALKQTVVNLRSDVDQLMQGTGQQVAQLVRHGVESTLGQQSAKYDQAVASTISRLDGAGHAFEQSALAMAAAAHRKTLTSLAAAAGATLLLIGGGSLLLWFQWQTYSDARARTMAAQVDAQTMEAYARVDMTSCGGRPCVKIDAKSPRWGSKGEYVLLDITSKPRATSPKN